MVVLIVLCLGVIFLAGALCMLSYFKLSLYNSVATYWENS